jgi:hypothetical protein
MRRPLSALALLVFAAPVWARGGGMGAMFIGENKNTNPTTTGGAADYMESSARYSPTGEEGVPPPPPGTQPSETPERRPQASAPDAAPSPAPAAAPSGVTPQGHAEAARVGSPIGGFVPRDPAAQRYYEGGGRERITDAVADHPGAPGEARKTYKLWDSVGKPIEMNAAQVAKTPGVDEADSAARAEYERRILGRSNDAGSASPAAASVAPMPAASGAPAGEVFVTVDVSASEQAALKDAVAGLTNVAGFRVDGRFPAQPSSFSSPSAPSAAARAATTLRGWVPADKVGAAVTAPGVLRVQVDRGGPRPEAATNAVTSLIVGLRIPAQASAGEVFKQTMSELDSSARFRWTKTIGFQAVPESRDVALVVVGEVPVTRIPKLLEHPAVLKIGPAPLEPAQAEPAARALTRLERFFAFTREKAPLLIALTLLLLLPSVGGALLKLGQAFVPYDR